MGEQNWSHGSLRVDSAFATTDFGPGMLLIATRPMRVFLISLSSSSDSKRGAWGKTPARKLAQVLAGRG
jgi:hypothetical protein